MAPAVPWILAPPLLAGAPPLVGHMRGKRLGHRRPLVPGGPAARGQQLGTPRLLHLLLLADRQGPALPACGGGALRALGHPSQALAGHGAALPGHRGTV